MIYRMDASVTAAPTPMPFFECCVCVRVFCVWVCGCDEIYTKSKSERNIGICFVLIGFTHEADQMRTVYCLAYEHAVEVVDARGREMEMNWKKCFP